MKDCIILIAFLLFAGFFFLPLRVLEQFFQQVWENLSPSQDGSLREP